jgi:shikimate kinase
LSARTIALVGLRASGKTSVGRALAADLGREFVDLDDEIAREAGRVAGSGGFESAGDVLARLGEEGFREIETRALERVLLRPDAFVLATGGGTVVRERNRALLSERAYVVWLDVPVGELQRRLRADPTVRPPLSGSDAVTEVGALFRARAPLYALAARWRIDASGGPPAGIARLVRAHMDSLGPVPGG